jgi:PPOX class probable FMN-dependent enzyme
VLGWPFTPRAGPGMLERMTSEPSSPDAEMPAVDLRSLYREPHELVVRKSQTRVDAASAAFVAASPLVVLATTSPDGADASPRGGPPGFVKLLDDTHVAFGDLSGNNRLDSYRNITAHPELGMLFLVPGVEETLRVNGRARVSVDDEVLDATTVDGRRPKVAIVVEVVECFLHCAKALRRSGVWDVETWPEVEARPSAAEGFVAHLGLDVDPAVVEADLEEAYRLTLWVPGGDADT